MKAAKREDGEPSAHSDSKDEDDDPDIDVSVPPDASDVLELTAEEHEHKK
jgi:hypothetical protein